MIQQQIYYVKKFGAQKYTQFFTYYDLPIFLSQQPKFKIYLNIIIKFEFIFMNSINKLKYLPCIQ